MAAAAIVCIIKVNFTTQGRPSFSPPPAPIGQENIIDAFNWFLKGILLGFSIAAPVGPIGVLCIRRTLAQGRLHGLLSGLGAATADGLYGLLAASGLTFLFLPFLAGESQTGPVDFFRLGGALFLLFLAARTFFSSPPRPAPGSKTGLSDLQAESGRLVWSYFSTLLLTLSNPMTILSFAAIFIGLGIGNGINSFFESGLLVAGVFSGSALWWIVLSTGVGLLRSRVTPGIMLWINRISGLAIAGFGVAALISAF